MVSFHRVDIKNQKAEIKWMNVKGKTVYFIDYNKGQINTLKVVVSVVNL